MKRSQQSPFFWREDKQLWVAILELPSKNGKRRRKYIYGGTPEELKQKLKTERRTLEDRRRPPDKLPHGRMVDELLAQARGPHVHPTEHPGWSTKLWCGTTSSRR